MEKTNEKVRVIKMTSIQKYRIRVEEPKEFDNSFFRGVYETATKGALDIISKTIKYHDKEKSESNYNNNFSSSYENDVFNNIIAFAGDRGAGKTSAMTSFLQLFTSSNKEKNDWIDKCELGISKGLLENTEFHCLDSIDPSMLEKNESIFETILAKIFDCFMKKCEESRNKDQYIMKAVFDEFNSTYENLKTLNESSDKRFSEDSNSEFNLETLSRLSASSSIKKHLEILIQKFLGFVLDRSNNNNNFLIIPIDDLDMDIMHAAKMMEQIRKYFIIPNVIILMAVKVSQLSDIVNQEYMKSFEMIISKGKLTDSTENMAAKYIEKLIPGERKIILPELRMNSDNSADLVKAIFDENDENQYSNDPERLQSVQDKLLEMVNKKTGLMFIKPVIGIHYLVPGNLRELNNFVALLQGMKEPNNENEANNEIIRENITKFEDYFINTWVANKLSSEKVKAVKQFWNVHDEEKNFYLVRELNKDLIRLFDEKAQDNTTIIQSVYVKTAKSNRNMLIESINSRAYNKFNIGFGDVFNFLKIYEELLPGEENAYYTNSFKVLYSIMIKRSLLNYEYREKFYKILGGNVFGVQAKKFIRALNSYETEIYYDQIKILYTVNGKKNEEQMSKLVEKIIDDYKNSQNLDYYKIVIPILEVLHFFLFLNSISSIIKKEEIIYNAMARFGFAATKRARFSMDAFFYNTLVNEFTYEKIFGSIVKEKFISNEIINNVIGSGENDVIRTSPNMADFQKVIEEHLLFTDPMNREDSIKNSIIDSMLLPLYSIDLLEIFFSEFNNDYKEASRNKLSPLIKHFTKEFKRIIDNYSINSKALEKLEMVVNGLDFSDTMDYIYKYCLVEQDETTLFNLLNATVIPRNASSKSTFLQKIGVYKEKINKRVSGNKSLMEEAEDFLKELSDIQSEIAKNDSDNISTSDKKIYNSRIDVARTDFINKLELNKPDDDEIE